MDKPKWLEIAEAEVGVKEIPGTAANPRIVEYAKHTTLKATSDEVPWCSSFVNFCIAEAGMKPTGLANARSWLKWGVPHTEPRPGCIVVLSRGNNPQSGHVGFYASDVGNGLIKVLGGNQGDQVKYSNFPKSSVIGYRWPEGVK
jgi:uncharacterized protein (TIGR02594 family)